MLTPRSLFMNQYKAYPQYKNSGIEWLNEIPEYWEVKKLKYSARIQGGKDQKAVLDDNGIYPVYGSGGIFGYANQYLYNGESVLLGRKGTVNKPLYVNDKFWTVDTMYYTILEQTANAKWLYYATTTIRFDYYQYGSAVPSMTQEDLHNIHFATPIQEEQQTIANYLDKATAKIDTLIEKQTKLIELLKEKRQAVISTAVTRGLDSSVPMKDSGVEWLGEIPEHWTRTPLRYIGRLQNGISKGGDYFGSGFPFVNYGDIYKNATLPQQVSGLAKSTKEDQHVYSVKVGDVFFTRTSETIDDIGMASTCIETIEKGTFSGFTIRFRQLAQTLDEHFSKYYFRTGHSQAFFEEHLNLVTRASLGQDILKQLSVLIPPFGEQKEIAQFLDIKTTTIDSLVLKATRSIELLKEKRTALISAVVTGKIDVRETA